MAAEIQRRDLIACLQKWKTSYTITHNQQEIDKCIRELVGDGQLIWFDYSSDNGFEDNDECKMLSFEAKKELTEIWTLNSSSTNRETWEAISKRIYCNFSKKMDTQLSEIMGIADTTTKRSRLIEFVEKCEKCYKITYLNDFIRLGKDAKNMDLLLNSWVQSRGHNEEIGFSNSLISNIGDDFLRRIADPYIQPPVLPPLRPYVIEPQEIHYQEKNVWVKFYIENYIFVHLSAFIIGSLLIYWQFSDRNTFWVLEFVLATAIFNIMIMLLFRFFYQERTNN